MHVGPVRANEQVLVTTPSPEFVDVVDGLAVGTWRRSPRKRTSHVVLTDLLAAPTRYQIDAAVAAWPP